MTTIEPLEARIAPAAITGNVLTYTDIDGDAVKVTFTGETPVAADILFASGNFGDSTPQELTSVTLTKDGAGFTLTATPKAGKGDSHANIELINGNGHDLGTINVDGDVDAIDAGSGTPGKLSIASFTALSMGRGFAPSSQSALDSVGTIDIKGDLVNHSLNITGDAKSITIGGNVEETVAGSKSGIFVTGDAASIKIGGSVIGLSSGSKNIYVTGDTGTLSIGGSVEGGSVGTDHTDSNSQITLEGAVKSLHVGGDVVGHSGYKGGTISIEHGLATAITIGGSLIGGTGQLSGVLFPEDGAGSITIGGSLIGSTADDSGSILADGSVGAVKIAGSVRAGNAYDSGSISAQSFTSISIGHDFVGGDSTGSAGITNNAEIEAYGGGIGTLTIGGSFIGGRVEGNGTLTDSSFITAQTLGTVKIGGGIVGNAGHLAYIVASGTGSTLEKVIGSISVKGSVQSASILTGYDQNLALVNLATSIGTITIGGDLAGSFITVGSTAGADNIPGTADDAASTSNGATIASVKIGGAFTGLSGSATKFHILAPELLALTIGHATYNHAALHTPGVEFDGIGLAIAKSVEMV